MNDADLYEAYAPTTEWWVLGVKLRPLSLGHKILLSRISSAFAIGGSVSYEDLAASVFVCAHDFKTSLDAIQNPKRYERTMRRWQRKLGYVDLLVEAAAFRQYLDAEIESPGYKYAVDEHRETGCPSIQTVKVALMHGLHFSENELLDRPWKLCLWDYLALKSLDGQVTFIDKENIDQAMATAKALAEKIEKGEIKWAGSRN